MDTFTGISLFSGICGLELGIKRVIPNYRTVCYVEKDRYCQGVIKSRIRSGELDDAPIWDDICTFYGHQFRGYTDLVAGSFPCKDTSRANTSGKGLAGSQSGLWYQMLRVVCAVRPQFVFVENPSGILDDGNLLSMFADLRFAGYVGSAISLSASESGAPFEGKRIFILAEAISRRRRQCDQIVRENSVHDQICERNRELAEAMLGGCSGESWRGTGQIIENRHARDSSFWSDGRIVTLANRKRLIKPGIRLLDNGIQSRVDKLRCLGNAIPPQQAALALNLLIERLLQNNQRE